MKCRSFEHSEEDGIELKSIMDVVDLHGLQEFQVNTEIIAE